ncbi:MAG: EamA family transporter [Anaerolineae bacterium]|jgi:drug/metabolite transporter (DMT)-like permease|nr:EamA family transporter [Anaerolineae bacterium]MBT7070487.1 EamA family transporter [Anaerolineae bacterium]MBT7324984.1 EamA family transporter [Anaerolineae bacterium]
MTNINKKTLIWIALIAIYLIWGSTYLAIRYVVESMPPFMSMGMRFIVAGVALYAWRIAKGDPVPTRRQWRDAGIIGLLLLVGGNGLVAWAEQFVPSGIAALLISTVPIWMVVIESLRPGGEKPTLRAIVGLVLGFGGVALMIGPGELSEQIGALHPLGLIALPAAALLWSFGSVHSKSSDLPESTLMTTSVEMLIGSAGLFLVSILRSEWAGFSVGAVHSESWIGLVYLSIVGSLGGFVAYAYLLKNAPISLVSTYAYVNPVIAIFLGAWIAQESLNGRTILAAMVILGAVILITTGKSRSKPTQPISTSDAEEAPPST